MRRFLSLILPLSLGLVLAATSCDPNGPDGGPNDAGSETPTDAGGDAGTDTDAGTDAGTDEEEPGDPCIQTEPQPTTCAYGSYCSSRSSTCQRVRTPACANFSKFPVSWDPATSTGPVTYAAELLSLASSTACPSTLPMRFQTRVRAYSPSGGLPTTASELSQVFSYVNPNGSYISDSSQFSGIVTSDDGKNTEFVVSNCIVDQPSVNLGFYFEEGNGLCFAATK